MILVILLLYMPMIILMFIAGILIMDSKEEKIK
jgi:hypothetical protein